MMSEPIIKRQPIAKLLDDIDLGDIPTFQNMFIERLKKDIIQISEKAVAMCMGKDLSEDEKKQISWNPLTAGQGYAVYFEMQHIGNVIQEIEGPKITLTFTRPEI